MGSSSTSTIYGFDIARKFLDDSLGRKKISKVDGEAPLHFLGEERSTGARETGLAKRWEASSAMRTLL